MHSFEVVGLIAKNWLIITDQSNKGVLDQDCMRPVAQSDIPKLHFQEKPDWNAPETVSPDSSKYYRSSRAIGRLLGDIDLRLPVLPRMHSKGVLHVNWLKHLLIIPWC